MSWKVCIWAAALAVAGASPAMAVTNLSLNVTGGPTFAPGDTVTVTLDVDTIAPPDAINGVQALLHYDNTVLTLVDIVPTLDISADGATTADDWTEAVQTDTAGDITYAVVINAAGVATSANHTVATATFTVINVGTATFTFRADAPPVFTKLTRESDNGAIFPVKIDSSTITLTCDDGNACTVDGFNGTACTHTPQPSNTVCRASAGACDIAEVCDGTANPCPADAVEPSSTVCRNAVGECDVAETCDGTSAACPAD
ncbi:MAG: cohesin domain-containing protein, partial [Phycisphaerae bacterium]